ncbi:hypothetical protein CSUB01_00915 [Colletotrichum sublineola]|uniref:Uncharacterized protein n=1 Tax=Colletotrichum sublineola TaxID=1173701 RepID=A0A066X897_COLSU|nr:hypothetical protein CSUB01_00915 [Colletotrichum sublineola]
MGIPGDDWQVLGSWNCGLNGAAFNPDDEMEDDPNEWGALGRSKGGVKVEEDEGLEIGNDAMFFDVKKAAGHIGAQETEGKIAVESEEEDIFDEDDEEVDTPTKATRIKLEDASKGKDAVKLEEDISKNEVFTAGTASKAKKDTVRIDAKGNKGKNAVKLEEDTYDKEEDDEEVDTPLP